MVRTVCQNAGQSQNAGQYRDQDLGQNPYGNLTPFSAVEGFVDLIYTYASAKTSLLLSQSLAGSV